MLALVLSIAALAVGPIIHAVIRDHPAALATLEGFILATIGGLVLIHILPEILQLGGWPVIGVALVGVLGPEVVERLLHHGAARRVHYGAVGLALLGLVLHAAIDGVALCQGREVALAVTLHRVPVGLTIWWLLARHGRGLAVGILALVAVSTVTGYLVGPGLLATISSRGLALFQALVVGTLLHVVLHQPHPGGAHGEAHVHGARRWTRYTGLGALLGLALLLVL